MIGSENFVLHTSKYEQKNTLVPKTNKDPSKILGNSEKY